MSIYMANEITVRDSFQINNGMLRFRSYPTSFTDDQDIAGGPAVGEKTVPTDGMDIDLSELTAPGWMIVQNLDDDNSIHVGVRDTTSNLFFPMVEVRPGTFARLFLSSYLSEELVGSGSMPGGDATVLHAKADNNACRTVFYVFER